MHSLTRAQIWSAVACLCTALLLIAAVAGPAAAARNPQARPDRSERSATQGQRGKSEAAKQRKAERDRPATSKRPTAAKSAKTHAPAKKAKASNRSEASNSSKADEAPHGKAHGRTGDKGATPRGSGQPGNAGEPATAGKSDSAAGSSATDDGPAGNKGSMKVRPVGTAAHPPRNYAHLPCEVQVDFYGSPHSGATVAAVSHAPTSPTGQTLLTADVPFSQSSQNPRGNELVGSTTLNFTDVVQGLTYHEQQGYHVKLTAEIDGPQGANVKHKVFWIDCAAPTQEDAPVDGSDTNTTTEDDVLSEDEEVGVVGSDDVTTPVAADAGDKAVGSDVTADDDADASAESEAAAEDRVLGVFEEREIGAAAEASAIAEDAALATGTAAASPAGLAATGISTIALALLALAGIGGGAAVLRRSRRG